MDISITPKKLFGTVSAPRSKSICHRALICAALSDRPTRLNVKDPPYDVKKTIELLKMIGARITVAPDYIDVVPIGELPAEAVFDCGQSGSTLRFAIPIVASLGVSATFTGSGDLSADHISSLMDSLKNHGCSFERSTLPIKMTGKIKNGTYYIPASESSQFASSLLMGLARTQGESRIVLLPPINSKRYIDQTVAVLEKFGADIEIEPDGYKIHGKPFVSPGQFEVEADFPASSVWLATGVGVKGLSMKSSQADETVIDVLVSMGALIFEMDGVIHSNISNLHSFCLHASQFPDIVTSLCAVAATAQGTSHIMGVGKLKYRESDRVKGICELINALGGKAYSFEEDIVIEGTPWLKGGEAPCMGDHRLVLAAAILSCKCKEPVIIRNAESVAKSYSNFWTDFTSVGGEYDVIRM